MKDKKETDYEKQLNSKIEERVSRMESPGYRFAARFSRRDYLLTSIVAVICLAFLIAGAYL